MPLEPPSSATAAAKNGMIRSHRFLGANKPAALAWPREQETRTAATCVGARRWR